MNLWLPVPPIAEQEDIAEHIHRETAGIVAVAERTQSEIALLREYRTRLIADVVTGKLDVREAAARLLARLDVTGFALDHWMAILDATRPEVQAAARALLTTHLAAVDIESVLARLAQHPDRAMRAFVVDLALAHLPPDVAAFERMLPLLRAVLFDVRPLRALRTRVLDLVITRGLASEDAALAAAGVLGDVLRSATHDVHERALRGLVELSLAWPIVGMGLASTVKLVGVAEGGAA